MTGQSVIPFQFDGKDITVLSIDGEAWFPAAAVCRMLDIANSRDAVSRLDAEEKRGVVITDTFIEQGLSSAPRGTTITLVNESGVYELAHSSRKEEAKKFWKWVKKEVLPSIRKTGSYGSPPLAPPVALTRREILLMALEAEERAEKLEAKLIQAEQFVGRLTLENEDMRPAARALSLVTAHESITPRAAAKALNIKPMTLQAWFRENKWTHKGSGTTLPQQDKINSGYLELKYYDYGSDDGEYYDQPAQGRRPQVMVTGLGMQKLAKIFVNSAPST